MGSRQHYGMSMKRREGSEDTVIVIMAIDVMVADTGVERRESLTQKNS